MKRLLLIATTMLAGTMPAWAQTPGVVTSGIRRGASDDDVRLSVSIDFDTRWRLDNGYRILDTGRTESAPGLSVAYDLLRIGQRITIAAALGWQREAASNTIAAGDGQTPATFLADDYYGAGIGRIAIRSWLDGSVRVAVGGTRARFALKASDGTFADRAWSEFASTGAGLRVHTGTLNASAVPGMRVALALTVEGGFIAGTPLSFKLADDGTDQLNSSAIPVGDLARAQPYLRLGFAARF